MTADPRTVPELLIRAAWADPATVALRTAEDAITYGDLLERARATAEQLRDIAAGPGTAVAIQLDNGVEWLVAYWGAALNRNVVVPLSPRAPRAEVDRQLAHARVAAVSSAGGLRPLEHGAVGPWQNSAPAAHAQDAVHLVQFTSGSTGEPKGAMLTHRGLVGAARHQAGTWRLAPGEAVFVPNPFCHILGLVYGVLMPAAARATVLTLPRFDLEAALDLLVARGAVALTGAPTHLQLLAERVERCGLELPALRLGLTGGAPMAPAWVHRVRETLGLEALINGYGMSEVGSVAHTRLDDAPEQVAASVGFLVPGLEGRIVDPQSGADLPDGEVGELWLRGPSVMRGYLDDEKLTREALTREAQIGGVEVAGGITGGWLRTRDLMRRDPDGRLSFVSRLDDMLTVGGYNVYPAEVERALLGHPEVAQAAVVGVAHDRLGSVPVAFVRGRRQEADRDAGPSASLDTAEVLEHCRAHLRGYMVPRHVAVLEELPVNRAGKVDRRRLAELAEGIHVE